jgi:hypothetical protein
MAILPLLWVWLYMIAGATKAKGQPLGNRQDKGCVMTLSRLNDIPLSRVALGH